MGIDLTLPGHDTSYGGITSQQFTLPGSDKATGIIASGQQFTIPGRDKGTGKIVSYNTQKTKWASLSNSIIFEAQQSATEMSMKPNIAKFVEQDLLQGKPRMQKLGLELQELKVAVKFHQMIMPFEQIKANLKDAAINGTVLQWIWGTGEAVGDFIILKWEEKLKKTDETGALMATEVELHLREYAGPGVADQTGIDAAKAAFANKPVTPGNLPPTPLNISKSLSDNIGAINTSTAKIAAKLSKLQQAAMSLERFKRLVQRDLTKIQQAVRQINTIVQIAKNLKNSPNLSAALGLVSVAAGALGLACGNNSGIATIAGMVSNLSQLAGVLNQTYQSAQVVESWFPMLTANTPAKAHCSIARAAITGDTILGIVVGSTNLLAGTLFFNAGGYTRSSTAAVIVSAINANSGSGYSASIISNENFIITGPVAKGGTINGILATVTETGSVITIVNAFTGGIGF